MTDTAPKTMLIVDDDVDYLIQLEAQLRAKGYNVVSAGGKDEALEVAQANAPDMAILDLMMEHMDDGFTLCYELKKSNPNMPVIMVTGVAAETGMAFDTATQGNRDWIKADVLLPKPVRFEQLSREIKRLLKEE
jgi:CheY-like chemotaxis protein